VPHRPLVALMIAVLALCVTTAAVASSASTPRIARGGTFRIKMTTESLGDCVAVVNYRDSGLQIGTVKPATDGRLAWAFPVSRGRPLGRATWYVRCGLSIQRSGAFIVINPPSSAG
jgi:hypothetical protein